MMPYLLFCGSFQIPLLLNIAYIYMSIHHIHYVIQNKSNHLMDFSIEVSMQVIFSFKVVLILDFNANFPNLLGIPRLEGSTLFRISSTRGVRKTGKDKSILTRFALNLGRLS